MSNGDSTLASLKTGERCVIHSIAATDPHVLRLMTLGLVEGAEVEAAGSAIGGDPVELRLFGRGISLRLEQAQHFQVAPLSRRD